MCFLSKRCFQSSNEFSIKQPILDFLTQTLPYYIQRKGLNVFKWNNWNLTFFPKSNSILTNRARFCSALGKWTLWKRNLASSYIKRKMGYFWILTNENICMVMDITWGRLIPLCLNMDRQKKFRNMVISRPVKVAFRRGAIQPSKLRSIFFGTPCGCLTYSHCHVLKPQIISCGSNIKDNLVLTTNVVPSTLRHNL